MSTSLERIREIAAVLDGMGPGELRRAMYDIKHFAREAQDEVSALLDVAEAARALPRAYIDEATNEVHALHVALDRLEEVRRDL